MRKDWIAVGGITLLALGLRLPGLDAKGFWEDEASTVLLVKRDFGGIENPKVPSADQAQPPPAGFELVESRRTDDYLLQSADPEVAPLVLTEPGRQ